MEWLWGIVVGFILGLAGGRVQSRWDRQSRVTEAVESLHSEISLNKEKIEQALSELAGSGQTRTESYLIVPLTRDAFEGSIADLGLLPRDTRVAVQRFYSRLHDLELIVYEGYLRQTIFPLNELEKRALETEDHDRWQWWDDRKRTLHDMFKKRAQHATEAGEGALQALGKLTDQSWWRRIVGR